MLYNTMWPKYYKQYMEGLYVYILSFAYTHKPILWLDGIIRPFIHRVKLLQY